MSILLETLSCSLLFLLISLGLAWPLAARLVPDAAERVSVSAALSLLTVFLLAWGVYVFDLSPRLLWALPVLAAGGLALSHRSLAESWRELDSRELLLGQLIISAWCVGWLSFVTSYSGGGWSGDWFEHWERTRFFLERWPLDKRFLDFYPLAARPPLANIVTGAFLAVTRADFAHYQLVSTLLGSLVYLPAALLARWFQPSVTERVGTSRHTIAVLAVLLMLNPYFVENATFAWTKLPAAFFVLAGLYFFLRAQADPAPRAAAPVCGACLAAGMLAHYSAGPYLVVLALVWLAVGWTRCFAVAWRRTTALASLAGALVLATWFGWSLSVYGAGGTLLSNSSVTTADPNAGTQFAKIALNLRDTLVPHFLRHLDTSLLTQTSPWGWWRDWFFQIYQLNLFFAFGSVAWLALLVALVHAWRQSPARTRLLWGGSILLTIFLGVAVVGARDTWGLAHICLQPLVLLGLAFLAPRWSSLGRAWRLVLIAGATVDFILGIALHFAVQNYALDRWLTPQRPPMEWYFSYTQSSLMNRGGKLRDGLAFLSDTLALSPAVAAILLGTLLVIGFRRARCFAA